MNHLRIPVATYRLQFNQQFRFIDTRGLVSYLSQLGISDLYASPILKARKGSPHGYDVTDPLSLNPELGTEADFTALVQELKHHNMGLLLDIVPNHMAASPGNPWWQDVSEKGNDSPYARFFDLDWLAFSKEDSKPTGYRRFFDIGDLVGVRVEDAGVFETIHSLIFKLIAEGRITGLRIDHIDGLYDPLQYLSRLQQHLAPQMNKTKKGANFYVIVEKILSGDETLPKEWPVLGTTGYDFANTVNALFVDGKGVEILGKLYVCLTERESVFADVVYQKKKQVMAELFPNELEALGRNLVHLAPKSGGAPRLSPIKAKEALIEVAASLPVYRTYTNTLEISPRDRQYLEHAFQEVRRRGSTASTTTLDFLQRVFLLDFPQTFTKEQKEAWLHFVSRWQQLTGAIMAKGFEDTALYSYSLLISLNEVGGDPGSAGLSVTEFHNRNLYQLKNWRCTLNATSTHDTKRSEDVRARINVLSEIPEKWERSLTRWTELNFSQKQKVNGRLVPEPNTEILLYQTLLGAWPLSNEEVPNFKERLKAYMVKAVREAKTHTNWFSPNEEYESTLITFVDSILESSKQNKFLEDFLRLEERIAYYGALNSLAQVLLKITSPGVPDFYQGTELWDFSLVDPDNRRPVDFKLRVKLLRDLQQQEKYNQPGLIRQLLSSWEGGQVKLYLTYKALSVRNSHRDVFQGGDYIPLKSQGERSEHICAFARRRGEAWVVVIIPRWLTKLVDTSTFPLGRHVWGNDLVLLPDGAPVHWLNAFTREKLRISQPRKGLLITDALSAFPVALLTNH